MLKPEEYKVRLEGEKQRLERMISRGRDSAGSHSAAGVNESFSNSGDDEYADAATELYTQELDVSMLNKFKHRLGTIKVALLRIDDGQFGTCIRCHQKIGEARLDAIPETSYCRDCEADVEVQD